MASLNDIAVKRLKDAAEADAVTESRLRARRAAPGAATAAGANEAQATPAPSPLPRAVLDAVVAYANGLPEEEAANRAVAHRMHAAGASARDIVDAIRAGGADPLFV